MESMEVDTVFIATEPPAHPSTISSLVVSLINAPVGG
jgi:hypothetical protein